MLMSPTQQREDIFADEINVNAQRYYSLKSIVARRVRRLGGGLFIVEVEVVDDVDHCVHILGVADCVPDLR